MKSREPLDLEGLARDLLKRGIPDEAIADRLEEVTGSREWAIAVLVEARTSDALTGADDIVREICHPVESGYSAGDAGLGCRGEGDFLIHRKIAEIIGTSGADVAVGTGDQDDAGVVEIPGTRYIVVAVDGMHSRLSHFPFIAGFHVARATIRDVIVMGSRPVALFSDIHLGNDGDVGKTFDYTAGLASVCDSTGIPLVAGSTLRIGGDLVLGDRLTGCAGAIGVSKEIKPRRAAAPGQVLVMTEGAGGGTIATAAIFYGKAGVARRTLNLKTIRAGLELLENPLFTKIHSMTDVTNGGIVGDAFQMAETAGVRVDIDPKKFRELIDRDVLSMLEELEIDPMGVSIDSLLLSIEEDHVDALVNEFGKIGIRAGPVGSVSEGDGVFSASGEGTTEIKPKFREAPYTPIKKVVDVKPPEPVKLRKCIDEAATRAMEKKRFMVHFLADPDK
jgi:hydrogenase expression/formation protein